jgi:hypothetical protein
LDKYLSLIAYTKSGTLLLNARRLLPYVIGLIVLAFALGSLPRGSPSGSLLFRSYWLLYLIYLAPFLILGLMVAMIVFVALNWRDIAGGIGFKIAQNRKTRKKNSRYSLFVWLFMWAIAIGVLMERPGSIFNPNAATTNSTINAINDGTNSTNPFRLAGIFPTISNLVQNSWFDVAFLGLLVVGGLVLVQSVRVAMKETSEMNIEELQSRQIEGLQATQDAIKLIGEGALDPRSRIIACFQRLVSAVSRLGVPVSSDQTARELERAIRSTFALGGSAINQLTELFEEARYSLHDISDEDAANARQYLESIAEELKIQLDS